MPPESSSRSSRKRSRQEYIPQIVIPDSDDLFGSPSPAPEARPAKKQRRFTRQETSSSSTSQAAAQQSSKARRTSAVKKQPGLKKEQAEEERLPDFGDSDDDRDGNDEIIDLLGSDDVAPLPVPRPPKEDNMVKLGKFQCVICMDDCTDLTVTHCGMASSPLSSLSISPLQPNT
jgi:E3 ubiquitin-protein ligase RNF5